MNLAKTLVLTCAALGLSVAAHAQDIVVNGSTTVLPVMQKAAESFMAANPDIKLVISGGGSGNGIKALGEKQCDVAMSSRDIKERERQAAYEAHLKNMDKEKAQKADTVDSENSQGKEKMNMKN